jgi:hypothetical protein
MVDEVPQTGLPSRQSVAGFGGRSDEVSEVHASYGRLTHILSLTRPLLRIRRRAETRTHRRPIDSQ